ncbi:cyclic nucleotide-binding domain-containing protein [Streptomyces sp. NPDC046316]|uniref:cyclic nucleotide-binding domain-containing protein n=1 Tax=Streptomyces sp. NPDC046316 TaxID=3154494 RepID=UPI0034064331
MSTMTMLLSELTPDARDRLLRRSRPVRIPADTRIFRERQPADRFWIIESGRVGLHETRPDHGSALVDTLVSGDLLGCSGMLPPYHWRHGATATTEVHALEFDGQAVRELCAEDTAIGEALAAAVAAAMERRLLT